MGFLGCLLGDGSVWGHCELGMNCRARWLLGEAAVCKIPNLPTGPGEEGGLEGKPRAASAGGI